MGTEDGEDYKVENQRKIANATMARPRTRGNYPRPLNQHYWALLICFLLLSWSLEQGHPRLQGLYLLRDRSGCCASRLPLSPAVSSSLESYGVDGVYELCLSMGSKVIPVYSVSRPQKSMEDIGVHKPDKQDQLLHALLESRHSKHAQTKHRQSYSESLIHRHAPAIA